MVWPPLRKTSARQADQIQTRFRIQAPGLIPRVRTRLHTDAVAENDVDVASTCNMYLIDRLMKNAKSVPHGVLVCRVNPSRTFFFAKRKRTFETDRYAIFYIYYETIVYKNFIYLALYITKTMLFIYFVYFHDIYFLRACVRTRKTLGLPRLAQDQCGNLRGSGFPDSIERLTAA